MNDNKPPNLQMLDDIICTIVDGTRLTGEVAAIAALELQKNIVLLYRLYNYYKALKIFLIAIWLSLAASVFFFVFNVTGSLTTSSLALSGGHIIAFILVLMGINNTRKNINFNSTAEQVNKIVDTLKNAK